MRTCHFTMDKRQKRSFYLTIVRSIFEHCSVIWCPQDAKHLSKFEAIQKRAIKWINGERFHSYSEIMFYEKQKELKILPIRFKFLYNDLLLFYKIVNGLVPICLPDYITVAEAEQVRYTRRTAPIVDHVDTSTFHSSIVATCDSFRNSFFYRTMIIWNNLPVSVRQSDLISSFKNSLVKFLWAADTDWPD